MAGPLRLRQMWVKYQNKVPDVSGSNQNIKTSGKTKLKLTELYPLSVDPQKMVKPT